MGKSVDRISFLGRDGGQRAGVWTAPSTETGRRTPAVLLCQGLSGRKELALPTVAAHFARAGLATLAFDYRGYGESEGERGWIDPAARVEDALDAFGYLAQRPEVDVDRLGIYGLSLGGPVAIVAASQEPRARCVVAVSPPANGERLLRALRSEADWVGFLRSHERPRSEGSSGDPSDWVELDSIFPFSPEFRAKYAAITRGDEGTSTMTVPESTARPKVRAGSIDAILAFQPEQAAARLGSRPLLLIAGANDDVATPEQVGALFERASGPKERVTIAGADHIDLDTGPGLREQIELASRWLTDRLRARRR